LYLNQRSGNNLRSESDTRFLIYFAWPTIPLLTLVTHSRRTVKQSQFTFWPAVPPAQVPVKHPVIGESYIMYRYLKPTNNHNRLTVLERIAQQGAQDVGDDIIYLRPETLTQTTALVPQFAAAIDSASAARSAQAANIASAKKATEAVSQYIRDMWVAVKRRKVREGQPAAVLVYYGLTLNGKSPQISSQDGWLTQAERLIQGEAAAVAAGYPALTAPTAAQLQIKLTAAQTAVSQRQAAKAAYENSAATLNKLCQQADMLIATAMHELRVSLRQETSAHRRETMRSYGARFSQKTEDGPVAEVEIGEVVSPVVVNMTQPYAVPATNGTAVHV
jgi:hypothetical protein